MRTLKGFQKLRRDLVISMPLIRHIIQDISDDELKDMILSLPDRLSYIFSAYYCERKPFSKIATDLRLSRNYVMNCRRWELKKIAVRIKEKAANNGG